MKLHSPAIDDFLSGESGAVTIDWVVITGAMILLGLMTGVALFNGGVIPLAGEVSETVVLAGSINPGQPEKAN